MRSKTYFGFTIPRILVVLYSLPNIGVTFDWRINREHFRLEVFKKVLMIEISR